MADQQCAATPQELAESRRRCWATDCQRTSRLDWCGWRYCVPHFWKYVLRDAGSWRHKLVKIRFTRLVRHRL